MSDQDFGHFVSWKTCPNGHSDFGILSNLGASSTFTWEEADTASAASPSQSGKLAITSSTYAAVIWDAGEPCSAKTAQAPESSLSMSPRSTLCL